MLDSSIEGRTLTLRKVAYKRWHTGIHAVLQIGSWSNVWVHYEEAQQWVDALRGGKSARLTSHPYPITIRKTLLGIKLSIGKYGRPYFISESLAKKIADDIEDMLNDKDRLEEEFMEDE